MPNYTRRPHEAVNLTYVTFRVMADTKHGEDVYVVGDIPTLGCWEVDQGIQLVTTPQLYPKWTTTKPIGVQPNLEINYKYMIFTGGKFSRWETLVGNRTVIVSGPGFVVDDIINSRTGGSSGQAPPRLDTALRIDSDMMVSPSSQSSHRDGRFTQFFETDTSSVPNVDDEDAIEEEGDDDDDDRDDPDGTGTDGHNAEDTASSLPTHDAHNLTPLPPTSTSTTMEGLPAPLHPPRSPDHQRRGARDTADDPNYRPNVRSASNSPIRKFDSKDIPNSVVLGNERSHARQSSDEFELQREDGLIIASYYLPVIVTRVSKPSNDNPSSGATSFVRWSVRWDDNALLSRKRRSAADAMRLFYVGVPPVNEPLVESEQEALTKALAGFRCIPVFVTPELHEKHWVRYCQGTLKQVFHNIVDVYGPLPTRWWNSQTQKEAWQAYTVVNQLFVDKVVEVFNENDLIWIHGNELLLLPQFIGRRVRPRKTHIGLFIHTPFPSSEIFRTLSVRNEILWGMLGADQIGFHEFGYARHFLTCCRRILGLTDVKEKTHGVQAVEYQGRQVTVTCCHAGIEPTFVASQLLTKPVLDSVSKLYSRIGRDRIVIVGVDVVERLKGIFLKFLAFEQLLQQFPEWRRKVCLLQVGIRSPHFHASDSDDDEDEVYEEPQKWHHDIAVISNRINDRFGGEGDESLVYYDELDYMSLKDRVAIWAAGNILMYTPVMDGLCLDPLEFVAVKGELAKKLGENKLDPTLSDHRSVSGWEQSPPVLILSEFAACSRVLSGGLRVNPWRLDGVVRSLVQALTMPLAEREARHAKDNLFVRNHTITEWAERVLTDLKKSNLEEQDAQVAQTTKQRGKSQLTYQGFGLGLGFRSIGFHSKFTHLVSEVLVRAYRISTKRLILLDFGGTLVSEEEELQSFKRFNREEVVLPKSMTTSLQQLCADPRNSVFIISGKEMHSLEGAFEGVPQIGLAAEHGYFFSWGKTNHSKAPSVPTNLNRRQRKREWEMLDEHFDNSWMELSRSIMDVYSQRTSGTYIELKGSTILWQYRDADPEFGVVQATELRDHLKSVLNAFPVEVSAGKGYVEVRPNGCDKGKASDHIIRAISASGTPPDFILALGDDVSDEKTFEYLANYNAKRAIEVNSPSSPARLKKSSLKMFTGVVGMKPSKAQYYVNDVDEVNVLLATLGRVSKKDSLSQSLGDIRLLDLFTRTNTSTGGGHSSSGYSSDQTEESSNELGSSSLRQQQRGDTGNSSSSDTNDNSNNGRPIGSVLQSGTATSSMAYSSSVPSFGSLRKRSGFGDLSSVQKYLDNIAEDDEEDDGIFF